MKDSKSTAIEKLSELERLLESALVEAQYYQHLSVEAGKKRVREIDLLTRINNEQKKIKEKLKYRVDLDALVNTVTTKFLELSSAGLDKKIKWALKKLGEFYQVDRSFIVQFLDNGKIADTIFEWCAKGIEHQKHNSRNLNTERCSWLMDKFFRHEPLCLHKVTDLDDVSLREFFLTQGIKSLIIVPMFYENRLFGALGFDSVKCGRVWNDEDIIIID